MIDYASVIRDLENERDQLRIRLAAIEQSIDGLNILFSEDIDIIAYSPTNNLKRKYKVKRGQSVRQMITDTLKSSSSPMKTSEIYEAIASKNKENKEKKFISRSKISSILTTNPGDFVRVKYGTYTLANNNP